MSRLINSTYITIDGAVENPQDWPSGRHQDDGRAQQIQTELLLSCGVLRTLLEAGLIDELRLWVHPLMIGRGQSSDLLFRDGTSADFELADVTRLASGIVILSYRV
jgi:RibD C-terminal domain